MEWKSINLTEKNTIRIQVILILPIENSLQTVRFESSQSDQIPSTLLRYLLDCRNSSERRNI